MELIQSIDASILFFVQDNLRTEVLNGIMSFFTHLGDAGLIWIAMGIALMCVKKYRSCGFTILFCLGLCFLVNNIAIKNIVNRARPYETLEGLRVLVSLPGDSSFPSGHSCASFAGAYAVTRCFKKGGWIYILAALIALSRIYVGVHYPTDVLAGAIVGTVVAAFAYWFRERYIHKI